jgi:peptidoglycan/xylan/chitin deacetylase (PgdA/CDA1 family)
MQIISLTFDDGLRCQIERGVPILDNYSLPATFFIAANNSPVHPDYCEHNPWRKIEWNDDDIKLLKGMVRRGHEIGSHSVWHKHPEAQHVRPSHDRGYDAKFEAEESKRLISELDGNGNSFLLLPILR